MRKHFHTHAVLILTLIIGAATCRAADFRNWTDSTSRTVEAAFGGMEGDQVKLTLRNGSIAKVPLAKLSPSDQEYVKTQSADKPNSAWPHKTELKDLPKATTVKEDAATKEFIYRTEHFEFRCDSKLGADVVREFARMFEGALVVNKALPLDLKPTPEQGHDLFVAHLFTSKEDYFKSGAIPGSAGVYMTSDKEIRVPLESLGVMQVGKRFAVKPNTENSTLIHELTHQMMNHWLGRLPTWYVEGSAEYIASQKYHMGHFSLTGPGLNVRKYLNDYNGIRGKTFTMWHVYHLMHIDPKTWANALGDSRTTSTRNYASANILTYYFYHVDDKGDAAHMIAYLRDIESGAKQPEAAAKHLVRGRAYKEIEKEVAKAMMKESLALDFTGEAEGSASAPQ